MWNNQILMQGVSKQQIGRVVIQKKMEENYGSLEGAESFINILCLAILLFRHANQYMTKVSFKTVNLFLTLTKYFTSDDDPVRVTVCS